MIKERKEGEEEGQNPLSNENLEQVEVPVCDTNCHPEMTWKVGRKEVRKIHIIINAREMLMVEI